DALLLVVEDEIKPRGLHRFHHRVPDPVIGLVVDLRGTGSLGVACISQARRAAGSGECRQNQCDVSYRLRNPSRSAPRRGVRATPPSRAAAVPRAEISSFLN